MTYGLSGQILVYLDYIFDSKNGHFINTYSYIHYVNRGRSQSDIDKKAKKININYSKNANEFL